LTNIIGYLLHFDRCELTPSRLFARPSQASGITRCDLRASYEINRKGL